MTLNREQFVLDGVSRETVAKLRHYAEEVARWNPVINLVSDRSLTAFWERHVLDSLQLFNLLPERCRSVADLGSGGGLPGLPLALIAASARPDIRVTLVESDQRKAAFLLSVARSLDLDLRIELARIEDVPPLNADVVTARALAPLKVLCSHVLRHLAADGLAILPKGTNWEAEVTEARRKWQFKLSCKQSETDPSARILLLSEIMHAA